MLDVIICDDNTLHLSYTAQLTTQLLSPDAARILTFTDPCQMFSELEAQQQQPDIAILDIQFPELNGIQAAQKLHRLAPDCKNIFLTSYLSYAPDAYQAEHVYFVLKEQMQERLPEALARALDEIRKSNLYFLFKADGSVFQIKTSKVLYLERILHKTKIATTEGNYLSAQTVSDILSNNHCENTFIRCHQSYWVNPEAVQKLSPESFELVNQESIPISRSHRQAAKEAFFSRMMTTHL